MTMTNLLITAGLLGSAYYILRADVRTGGKMLRQNLKTIRSWVDEAQAGSPAAKEEVKQITQKAQDAAKGTQQAGCKAPSKEPPDGLQ
mmetsp:Transcript_47749/g.121826  ORF Transcript_47749/g.121826 Transcript_47749/m.121826 type:complete len:88 (-) Transcript_47749:23-286(-)|eukprot:jgi/Tetstr1/437504/TSEL_026183.t1